MRKSEYVLGIRRSLALLNVCFLVGLGRGGKKEVEVGK